MCAPMWHGTQWMYHQPLHLIRSVQGLLPSSSGASPSPGCLSLVSRLGYLGNTPSKGIPFLGCLLFSRLSCHGRSIPFLDCLLFNNMGCPDNTHGRGISFPDCLLFNNLGCPNSTPGRGIPFPDNLLLFSRLGCPGSTHGRGILFPHYLLMFSRLGCPNSTPGKGISFPDCLLLFSPLHYTQSPGTVTHLSYTHYVCEAPPDNPSSSSSSSSLPPALLQPTLIIFLFPSFLPSFFPYCIATTNNINSSWQPITKCLILNPLLITNLIFWFLSKSYRLKVGGFFFSLGWNQFSTFFFSLILWDFFFVM